MNCRSTSDVKIINGCDDDVDSDTDRDKEEMTTAAWLFLCIILVGGMGEGCLG